MSESVSGVDAILAGLRASMFQATYVAAPGSPKPLAADWCVLAADAEAAVHATAQKYEAALARQGALLDRCRDERLSWEDVKQHTEAAVHATVREIEAWLRNDEPPVDTPPPNPYPVDGGVLSFEKHRAYVEGFAAGLAARDTQDGECRAPHCWSEYGTPCGTCPKEKR